MIYDEILFHCIHMFVLYFKTLLSLQKSELKFRCHTYILITLDLRKNMELFFIVKTYCFLLLWEVDTLFIPKTQVNRLGVINSNGKWKLKGNLSKLHLIKLINDVGIFKIKMYHFRTIVEMPSKQKWSWAKRSDVPTTQ